MYPEIFRLGPFILSSYGLMLALAYLSGLWITSRLAARRGIDNDTILNLSLLLMISAIAGARLLYVLTHLSEFRGRWLYTVIPVQPDGTVGLSGLILLGGVIGAVFAGVIFVRRKRLPVWVIADSAAPALALGLVFGRIGCFLNGCCFGEMCRAPWALRFPAGSAAHYVMGDAPLHPTQLYAAGYNLLIFVVLLGLLKINRPDGFLSGIFLIMYGISRFIGDFFRYYESRMLIFGGLELNQMISLTMIFGGVLILWSSFAARRREGSA